MCSFLHLAPETRQRVYACYPLEGAITLRELCDPVSDASTIVDLYHSSPIIGEEIARFVLHCASVEKVTDHVIGTCHGR